MVDRQTMREDVPVPAETPKTAFFRPRVRSPMALLIALDDGSTETGETWRLRVGRHVIGRKKGDTIIADDWGISSEHAAITRELRGGEYAWHLIDLGSTNGTFLRVHKGALSARCELLLGGKRYVFHAEAHAAGSASDDSDQQDETPPTQLFLGPTPAVEAGNCLAECGPEGVSRLFAIQGTTTWIGRASDRCQVVLTDDPLVCPRHACIRVDSQGRWVIQDANSVNGVWIRVERVRLIGDSAFQVGEQRFLIKFLPDQKAK